jgi:hypothetical protein
MVNDMDAVLKELGALREQSAAMQLQHQAIAEQMAELAAQNIELATLVHVRDEEISALQAAVGNGGGGNGGLEPSLVQTLFAEFRETIHTIVRAQAANIKTPSQMGPGPGGGGAAEKFKGTCHSCGRVGHKLADCRKGQRGDTTKGKGKGLDKGAGKGKGQGRSATPKMCFRCGKPGHFESECRSPEVAANEHKKTPEGGQNFKAAEDQQYATYGGDFGGLDFCAFRDLASSAVACDPHLVQEADTNEGRAVGRAVGKAARRAVGRAIGSAVVFRDPASGVSSAVACDPHLVQRGITRSAVDKAVGTARRAVYDDSAVVFASLGRAVAFACSSSAVVCDSHVLERACTNQAVDEPARKAASSAVGGALCGNFGQDARRTLCNAVVCSVVGGKPLIEGACKIGAKGKQTRGAAENIADKAFCGRVAGGTGDRNLDDTRSNIDNNGWKLVGSRGRKQQRRKQQQQQQQLASAGQLCAFAASQATTATKITTSQVPELSERADPSNRNITFTVDSAACRTVVPCGHAAARGYHVHADAYTGQVYGTAKKNGPRINDEGRRVLQTTAVGGQLPRRLNTRKADVSKALLAVCDMVDHGQAVLFDSGGSYAFNKKTGARTPFVRRGKDWVVEMTLEAPDKANEIYAGILAEFNAKAAVGEEPEISLTIQGAGDGRVVVGSIFNGNTDSTHQNIDAAARSSFLQGRAEPLFR